MPKSFGSTPLLKAKLSVLLNSLPLGVRPLIETWISWKREKEIDPMRLRPHPFEFSLYYDN